MTEKLTNFQEILQKKAQLDKGLVIKTCYWRTIKEIRFILHNSLDAFVVMEEITDMVRIKKVPDDQGESRQKAYVIVLEALEVFAPGK